MIETRHPGARNPAQQRFARGQHQSQRVVEQLCAFFFIQALEDRRAVSPERGHRVHDGYRLLFDHLKQGDRIFALIGASDHDGRAPRKWQQQLTTRRRKSDRSRVQIMIARINVQFMIERLQIIRQIAVFDHHAFGLSGRTRCVDDVSEIRSGRPISQILDRVLRDRRRVLIE